MLVTVLDQENLYSEYTDKLSDHGFKLLFSNISNLSNSDKTDVYIVSIKLLQSYSDIFNAQNIKTPYLISGTCSLPKTKNEKQFIYRSVGLLANNSIFHDLILNLELGLSWHAEREKNERRLSDFEQKIENNRIIGVAVGLIISHTNMSNYEDVFSMLRSISRNKQRRISDVAIDVTEMLSKQSIEKISSEELIKNLESWAEENIPNRG